VDPNAREVGYRAAELLESLIAGQDPPAAPIRVPPLGLVRRASSDILAVEDPAVARALEFIRDSVETPTTVDDVLDCVGVSRSSLERKFHRQIGRTPLQEIRRVHLQAVRQLLIETQLPMSEIARRCGFSSPERLATVFGQQEGVTPTEFRRRFQQGG
jgi:LacI family transcriptional regulator